MRGQVLDVAVCVVQSPDGRVLLAERTARQVAAGFWELPGGKVDPGETAAQAAARELREETGLNPVSLESWMTYEHQFPTRRLRLHFFRARRWEGTALGREGQRLAWADPGAPHVGPILSSNDRALFSLAMPPVCLMAELPAHGSSEDFLRRLHEELSGGARLISVRLPSLAPGQRSALLARVALLADAFPQATILTGSAMDSSRAGLAGVHSCSRELHRLATRPSSRVWAATCHDEPDMSRAVSMGADFIVLSPVLAGPEASERRPLGWEGVRRFAAACPIAVFAEGGVSLADLPAAKQAGAAGVVVGIAGGQAGNRHARAPHMMAN